MTDGHGVPVGGGREHYTRRILTAVEAGNGVSQRSLARSAGIALGLTNLVLKRSIRKGWIRMIRIQPNRVRYLITPAGLAEKARMSRAYLAYTTRFYAEARDRIRECFDRLSAEWPFSGGGTKRVAFLGTGEVAEIGYVCIQGTDLSLAAVVGDDSEAGRRFCGMPVLSWDELAAIMDEQPVVVVVMSFDEAETVRRREQLAAFGVSGSHVCSL